MSDLRTRERGARRGLGWRERLIHWILGAPSAPGSPYRTAAPDLRGLAALDAPLPAGWRAGRASVNTSLQSALDSLRELWTRERVVRGAQSLALGLCSGLLARGMISLAPVIAPRVSTPMTHLLAVPCGGAVGLCAGIAFLALGFSSLLLVTLALASLAYGLRALIGVTHGLVVVSARASLATLKLHRGSEVPCSTHFSRITPGPERPEQEASRCPESRTTHSFSRH